MTDTLRKENNDSLEAMVASVNLGGTGVGPSPGAKMALGQGFAVGPVDPLKSSSASTTKKSIKEPLPTLSSTAAATAVVPAPPEREDDWGMSGLADILRIAQASQGLTSAQNFAATLGYDPDSLGLGLEQTIANKQESPSSSSSILPLTLPSTATPLCYTFLSPWLDDQQHRRSSFNRGSVSLEAILPPCYNVQAAPPLVPAKLAAFSDETLFYMFYAMPRDSMQEAAARELCSRGWRFHKGLLVWTLRGSTTNTVSKADGGKATDIITLNASPTTTTTAKPAKESLFGYIFFEPKTWSRVNGTVPLDESLLEEHQQQQQQQSSG